MRFVSTMKSNIEPLLSIVQSFPKIVSQQNKYVIVLNKVQFFNKLLQMLIGSIFPIPYLRAFSSACIQVDGHDVLLVFLVDNRGHFRIMSHQLHVSLRFVESSICVEEKKKLE